jgi:hypothetical protein
MMRRASVERVTVHELDSVVDWSGPGLVDTSSSSREGVPKSDGEKKHRERYPAEFREQMVARAGRTPDELAEDFEPTSHPIRNWVRQADLDKGSAATG